MSVRDRMRGKKRKKEKMRVVRGVNRGKGERGKKKRRKRGKVMRFARSAGRKGSIFIIDIATKKGYLHTKHFYGEFD